MSKISAVIVIKDHPPYALDTVKSAESIADEIVIIDIGIESKLKNRLKKNKLVKVVTVKEEVPYIELIRENFKKYVKNDYILYLDPDETLTPDLAQLIKVKATSYNFMKLPRKNIILGKWIEHSHWWPDYQVRVYKKDAVSWPTRLHAQPETQGEGYTVDAVESLAIVHHNYSSLDEYLQKSMRYSKSEARQSLNSNTDINLSDTIRKSLSEFIGRYFAHEGYKDGMHGFALALMQMMYYFLVYFYYWEGKKYSIETHKESTIARNFFLQGLIETNHWIIQKNLTSATRKLRIKLQNLLLRILH